MTLLIKSEIKDRMIEHAKKDAPIEACGYLGGRNKTVTEIFPIPNADNSPVHYTFAPEDQFRVLKEARSRELELLAVYHSHPASPARMSDEDIKLAFDPGISYVIVSIADGVNDIKSFTVKDESVSEEEVEVI